MTDSEFEALADAVLNRIEQSIEASELDVDLQSKAGGLLEIRGVPFPLGRLRMARHARR
jgi:frataxin-like iron-binding protein CyaY